MGKGDRKLKNRFIQWRIHDDRLTASICGYNQQLYNVQKTHGSFIFVNVDCGQNECSAKQDIDDDDEEEEDEEEDIVVEKRERLLVQNTQEKMIQSLMGGWMDGWMQLT